MLEAKHIALTFDRPILKGINFSLKTGQIIGIVGKSGAGKTSFLKIMSGLLDSTTGDVFFEGKKVLGPTVKLVPGHPDIQLVNQDFHLDTYHTVEENIREQILYLPKKERDQLVNELLELIELDEVRTQKARTLSGGEQQRLAIARALACEPKVLLLDEPFVHLDGRLRSKLTNYLLALKEIRGTSFVLVSHDGAEMLSLADVIYTMKNGQLTKKGKPSEVYYRYKVLEEAKLFGAINSIKINDKRIAFRPDEYSLEPQATDEVIQLTFVNSLFTGPVYENYFLTERKEKVVLISLNALKDVTKIAIKKKSSAS